MAERKEKSAQKTQEKNVRVEVPGQIPERELSTEEVAAVANETAVIVQNEVNAFIKDGAQTAQEIAAESGGEVNEETQEELLGLDEEAKKAERELLAMIEEELLMTVEAKETIITKEIDYHDNEGNLIATAVIELEQEPVETHFKTIEGLPGRAHILRSFIMKGFRGGAPTEVDMLALSKAGENGIKVLVAEEALKNYHYVNKDRTVLVPPLESPHDIAVALHELGHADQYQDKAFESIALLYKYYWERPTSIKQIKEIMEAMPETQRLLPQIVLDNMELAEERGAKQGQEINELDERISAIKQQQAEFEQEIVKDALEDIKTEAFELYNAAWSRLDALGEEKSPEAEKQEIEQLLKYLESRGLKFPETKLEPAEMAETETWPPLLKSEITGLDMVNKLIWGLTKSRLKEEQPFDDSQKKMNLEFLIRGQDLPPMRAGLSIDIKSEVVELYKKETAKRNAKTGSLSVEKERAVGQAQHYAKTLKGLLGEVEDITKLPGRMMERDATRRAFQWMRVLRLKYGIDLFKNVYAEAEKLIAPPKDGDCEQETDAALKIGEKKIVATNVQRDLTAALATYRGTTKEMFRTYKKIPRARGKSAP